ncbi:phage integrase [Mycobacteroides abscessus subsp. abscessus]|uniref:site-specific integrase n=1 Tax=Mycobacteroides abscessus TaxID=36809 RepID=UPI0009A5E3C7|nr:tyrosine-type recombinase/integrase [Mycobacteroides abscessus]RIR76295.1 site-specific integrase [Mycobacteroides abscessus]RIT52884.1 site-specific integrase [Mycobacteroides abscessus]RIU50946.1 site-specific integrase [Mycobacteroides abscessus]SKD22102.1 phage integrase [Mycobacteroides abscessus subsp. abscessus]
MGRPPLGLGEHGKPKRRQLGTGKWEARCYYRDLSGEMSRPRKQTPMGVTDRHGAAAEQALLDHIKNLRRSSPLAAADTEDGAIASDTSVSTLLQRRLDKMKEDNEPVRTQDTYRLRFNYWNNVSAGITVGECTPGRLYRILEVVQAQHGHTTARQLRGNLVYVLDEAVRDGALETNPARAIAAPPKPKNTTKTSKKVAAQPIDPKQLPDVMDALATSDYCIQADLTDPILMHIATGLRVSEVLALRWAEFSPEDKTVAVTGRVVRGTGVGLMRQPVNDESRKRVSPVIALPKFAVDMLLARAAEPRPGGMDLIFPSSVGTLRDTNSFAKQWRKARVTLGETLEKTTGHSFRKTLGNLVTDERSDPRIAADMLGHTNVSTTLKYYLQRNRVHHAAAELVENAVKGNGKGKKPDAP